MTFQISKGRGWCMEQRTLSPHPINRWFQRLTHDLFHDDRSCHRGRRICAHSTRVKPRIALSDTFVVLRSRKWDDGVTVGECKDGDLWSNEQLFDDDLVTCWGGEGRRRPSKSHAMRI